MARKGIRSARLFPPFFWRFVSRGGSTPLKALSKSSSRKSPPGHLGVSGQRAPSRARGGRFPLVLFIQGRGKRFRQSFLLAHLHLQSKQEGHRLVRGQSSGSNSPSRSRRQRPFNTESPYGGATPSSLRFQEEKLWRGRERRRRAESSFILF